MHKAGAATGKTTTSRMAAASRHGAFDTDDPSTSCSRNLPGNRNDEDVRTMTTARRGGTGRRWRARRGDAANGGLMGSTGGDESLITKTRRGGERERR